LQSSKFKVELQFANGQYGLLGPCWVRLSIINLFWILSCVSELNQGCSFSPTPKFIPEFSWICCALGPMLCRNCQLSHILDISHLGFAQGRCQTTEKGAECAPCNGVTFLELEIQQRIEELRPLLDRHRALRTEWNSTHDIISRIPQEIVSEIFQHCKGNQFEDESLFHDPETKEIMKLGTVCQRWRQIAWSTPHLWTEIRIHRPKEITSLQEWISRSGCLPLLISIRNGAGYNDIWKATLQALAECSQRWRDVYLCIGPMMVTYLLRSVKSSMIRRLHMMRGRHLDNGDLSDEGRSTRLWPSFPSVSAAHNARLEGSTPAQITIDWRKLTHLVISGVASTNCRYILGEAPALTSLHLECPVDNDDGDEARNAILTANPLVHRGLQSLIYIVGCPDVFLSFLTLPNLNHFSYSIFTNRDDNGNPSLLPFILRSAFPLQKLELNTPYTYEITRSILMAVPSITHLRLYPESDHFDAIEAQFMEELIATLEEDPIPTVSALGGFSTPQGRARIHQFLPNLQILQTGSSDDPGPDYLRENKFIIDEVELAEEY